MKHILASGELDGYEPGLHLDMERSFSEAFVADDAAAKVEDCKKCGHKGLSVTNYHKGLQYKQYNVCPECDEAVDL
jgi:ribosomal protein L32